MAAKQNCGRVCKTFRLIKSVVTIPEIRNLYVTLYKFSTRQRTVNLSFFIARRMAQPAPGNKPGVMERIAVVSVALVLVLVLQREEAHCGRETRTEYLQPNYGQTGGFRVSSAPSNETIIPYRYWLIEGQVSEIDYDIVPGRRMSLRTARTGQMLYPAGFFDLAFEDVQQYDIDGVTVTQRQNAGRITGISWTREGYEYLLYSLQPEMNMIAGLAVEFVTNTRAEAVV